MRVNFWNSMAAGLLAVVACGCDNTSRPPSGTNVKIDTTPNDTTPRGRVDVDAGPGGVDVEVGRDGKKPAVDVDVDSGKGVKVDVDGKEIRERIRERREERQEERDAR